MPGDAVGADLRVRLSVKAVLGAVAVTGGLWFLQGGLQVQAKEAAVKNFLAP